MLTDDGARAERLEQRARAVIAALSVDGIAGARWSGLAGSRPRSVELLEVFAFDDGGALAILSAVLPDGAAVLLTLPLEDAPPWQGLHNLASRGGAVPGVRGGRLLGHPGTAVASRGAEAGALNVGQLAVRPSPVDQSHTSVILGERSMLKLYRRLAPGPNPEAELLGALAAVPGAPVPAWHGAVELVLRDGTSTAVAIEQAYVTGAVDAFELVVEGLAEWLAGGAHPVSTEIAAGSGLATGRLHAALAGIEDPAFRPRPAPPDDRAAWLRAAENGVDVAIDAVRAVDPGLAERIERSAGEIQRLLRPLADGTIPVRLQRIHGDLHIGQVLPVPGGMLIVDLEGDPTRDAADRRALADPLRDLASYLRSIDHAARSAYRRADARTRGALRPGAPAALDGWIDAWRRTFLAGYAAGLGDPGWAPDGPLLRAHEMEKEMGEFVYAASFLPDWLYAPAGGLGALLGASLDPVMPT